MHRAPAKKRRAEEASLDRPGIERPPARQRACGQCQQTTSDWEKDLLPETHTYLKWAIFDKNPENDNIRDGELPSGYECYFCFDTRRKHWGKEVSREQLKTKRQEGEDEKFVMLRRARVRGEDKYTRPKGEDKVYSKESEKEYGRVYTKTKFRRVDNWLRDQGVDESLIKKIGPRSRWHRTSTRSTRL